MSERRTIRRYAHELYPHPDEWEVQPLTEAVPYLYARACGLEVWGTDWHALGWSDDRTEIVDKTALRVASDRTLLLIAARSAALHADALLQGLAGEEAWQWAEERACEETGEWVYERAAHYGVPVERIKPYPVIAPTSSHNHYSSSGNVIGHGIVTRVDMPEDECPDCTELVEKGADR